MDKYLPLPREYNDSSTSSIVLFDMVSSSETELDFNQQLLGIGYPVWSPDGQEILFSAWSSDWSSADRYTIHRDGTGLTNLTSDGEQMIGWGDWQSIPNLSPTTTPDALTTTYNTAKSVDVLANDTDEEALDGQYLTIATQPLNGTGSIVDGKVKYTPDDGFTGSDQLTYQICDSFLLDQKCTTGVLGITVQAPGAPALTVSKVGDTTFNASTSKYETSTKRPTFSGTASPGATVKVEIHSDPILLTTTANGTGEWSVTPSADLPVGEHTVYITATLNGSTAQLDSFVLAIADEAAIPNTGASTWPLRFGGLTLIGLGLGLGLTTQRKLQRHRNLPQLF